MRWNTPGEVRWLHIGNHLPPPAWEITGSTVSLMFSASPKSQSFCILFHLWHPESHFVWRNRTWLPQFVCNFLAKMLPSYATVCSSLSTVNTWQFAQHKNDPKMILQPIFHDIRKTEGENTSMKSFGFFLLVSLSSWGRCPVLTSHTPFCIQVKCRISIERVGSTSPQTINAPAASASSQE